MESMAAISSTSRQAPRGPKQVGLWKLGRSLGYGASGHVHIAKHTRTGKYAAIKIISKKLTDPTIPIHTLPTEEERVRQFAEREIVIMKLLDHPNIVHIHDVWETSSTLYLVLEYVKGGDLHTKLESEGLVRLPEAVHYFQQIISAVDHFHRFNIAHRDLKLENILVDENNNIKIGDFGMAIWQAEGSNNLLKTICGSPHYAAPEIIQGKRYKGTTADIWSCGIILFALVTGDLPFHDSESQSLLDRIVQGKVEVPRNLHPQAQDLLRKMLNHEPEARIKAANILLHPFYRLYPAKPQSRHLKNPTQVRHQAGQVGDVDPCILANLKALWHGVSEDELLATIQKEGPSWQKTVYWLLIGYRDRHVEAIRADEADEKRIARARTKRKESKGTHVKSLSARHSNNMTGPNADLPPRNDPPTPRRAAKHVRSASETSIDVYSKVAQRTVPARSVAKPMALLTPPKVINQDIQQFYNQLAEQMNELGTRMTSSTHDPLAGETGSPLTVKKRVMKFTNRPKHSKEIGASNVIHKQHYPPAPVRVRGKENLNVGIGPPPRLRFFKPSDHGASTHPVQRTNLVDPISQTIEKQTSRRSPDSVTTPSSVSPKRRWLELKMPLFGPPPFLLMSTCDLQVTRNECKRLLMEMDVDVSPESEGSNVLKCTTNEFRDPAGVMASLKPVKFKVVFQPPRYTTHSDDNAYGMSLTLIHAKGSPETFREVCRKLEQEWMFDPSRSEILL